MKALRINNRKMRKLKKSTIILMVTCFVTTVSSFAQVETNRTKSNVIHFEKTDYGLVFTTINVNNQEVRAMVDFGDMHILQLSSTLTAELRIDTEKAGYRVSDVFGNTWDVMQGIVNQLTVGSWTESDVKFTSQEGEMEAVSAQIGTQFNAVLGWGYFKRYFTEIDYSNSTFTLSDNESFLDNIVFTVPFQKDANQLIIKAKVKGQEMNFMIDTGSPVTVVDPRVLGKFESDEFGFELQTEDFKLNAYEQDLSVLADLEIACILGGDFLAGWKVVIDPEKSLLYFKK